MIDIGGRDQFDNWAYNRDRRYDESRSARYVSHDVVGYEDLDDYGDWRDDSNYGHVWFPNRVTAGWAPYHEGHWVWISPWDIRGSMTHHYRNPQAQQASVGIERQIGNSLSISANYIYVHTTHLPWAVDTNLLPGAPIVSGVPGANGLPTNGLPFQDWGAPPCINASGQRTTACLVDPAILQNNEYASVANAVYHGGIVEVRKRLSGDFSLLASYTYSKAIDDSTDFNSDYAAFNEVNLAAERSLSDFDQRHKIVLAAVLESPWQHSPVLSGFALSPIMSYNSGHPFNLLAGADINGDNHSTNDRPPGAPRNSGLGPNYATLDLRLSKRFKFGEGTALQFSAEGFNLFSRTNYAAVNNVVGADLAPPFNVHGTASLLPSQPLAYTAALPRREVQLGIRFEF
ncbi:MAG: DUF6600 domain-containing protein [Terriglobales bacterium]